ncbi:MAG: hypothetical protein MUF84_12990 [Anaerolineae bacterium]|jgi:hypothetical protein|nr:hypothetical protein [Anaerolineae bacterium]
MKTGRLIGGIACLVVAAVLAVLIIAVPGKVMYYVDERNVPWLPVGVIAVAGIILVATAPGRPKPAERPEVVPDPERAALNRQLETIAWGCFLVLFGAYMLVPHTGISEGVWSIVVGLIFLGLNAARYVKGIRMSGFTTFLGILSIVGGIVQLLVPKLADGLEGAFLLIILGAFLILKPWAEKRRLFGKAEEA